MRLTVRVRRTYLDSPWELKQLMIYSQCLGCRFSPAGIEPLHEKLTLCPKRMALSLCTIRSQREEGHSGPFLSRSSSFPREGRDGLEVLFLMQNLSPLPSKPGVPDPWWPWTLVLSHSGKTEQQRKPDQADSLAAHIRSLNYFNLRHAVVRLGF